MTKRIPVWPNGSDLFRMGDGSTIWGVLRRTPQTPRSLARVNRARSPSVVLSVIFHAPTWRHGRCGFLLRDLRHHGFRREEQACDRRRVLEREPDHFPRIDDPGLRQVLVGLGRGVEADVARELLDLGH